MTKFIGVNPAKENILWIIDEYNLSILEVEVSSLSTMEVRSVSV